MTSRRVPGGVLIAAAVFLVAALAIAPPTRPFVSRVVRHFTSPTRAVAPGQPLGSMSFTALDGSTVALGKRTGRAMVINVFTSWCTSCVEEMPALSSVARNLQRSGVDVVGVDQDESADRVSNFARSFDLQYPIYIDDGQVSRFVLGARVIPTTVFVDRHDVVRAVHVGPLNAADFVAMAKSLE
jgi:thiol-disulfide isomerase/thioredoxin